MDAELARAQGDALAKAVGGLRFRSAQDAQKAAQQILEKTAVKAAGKLASRAIPVEASMSTIGAVISISASPSMSN